LGRKIIIGNGQKTLFWHDKWLYDNSLIQLFPDLFDMCNQQNISVEKMKINPSAVTFTRFLVDIWKENWDQILLDTASVCLDMRDDKIAWKFGKGRKRCSGTTNGCMIIL
jgi:hypothetical protein